MSVNRVRDKSTEENFSLPPLIVGTVKLRLYLQPFSTNNKIVWVCKSGATSSIIFKWIHINIRKLVKNHGYLSTYLFCGRAGFTEETPKCNTGPATGEWQSLTEDCRNRMLKIGTLNVKNFETNRVFAKEMLQSCDILALQEHWLFSFQLSDINRQFPAHNAFTKYVDENSPLPPTQKPLGYGGVSILYRKNMSCFWQRNQEMAK